MTGTTGSASQSAETILAKVADIALTPKLASRTFWTMIGSDLIATIFRGLDVIGKAVISETTWSGIILGTLTIWVGGKWVAGKAGKVL